MAKAFQTNAFQSSYPSILTAFQGFSRFSRVTLVSVRRLLLITLGLFMEYKAGATVVVTTEIKDPSSIPNLLFDPTTVRITVYNPDDTVRVNDQSMVKISTGIYSYNIQTLSNWPLGAYTGFITSTSGANTDITITQVFFTLV